jgi:hypothetical protein
MNKLLLILAAAGAAVIISSCKKETCNAGKGGSFALQIFPEHHGDPIPGSTVFIEFNTQSSPASISDFDLKLHGESISDYILIENMRCGDYYIYCVGTDWDSTVSETVKGGIPYSVAEGAGGTVKIVVPVTE